MSLLPFGTLEPFKPRQFLPGTVDFGDWNQISPLFDRLKAELHAARTPADLERWLINWGEVSAALDCPESGRLLNVNVDHHQAVILGGVALEIIRLIAATVGDVVFDLQPFDIPEVVELR